ncbi:hypothetical protein [Arthrobacter sp. A5]|uniref:hypothetical protein n=1 Tax=Arthrobacter sp. A5 TaxID=576926 RepID=UPI003DA7D372
MSFHDTPSHGGRRGSTWARAGQTLFQEVQINVASANGTLRHGQSFKFGETGGRVQQDVGQGRQWKLLVARQPDGPMHNSTLP